MVKRMDVFTEDFSPPGVSELPRGANPNKRDAPYADRHTNTIPESDPKFYDKRPLGRKFLHSAGNPKEQESLDFLDQIENQFNSKIKNPTDQFPGAVDMDDHKAIAGFDIHQTDPARLKKMSPFQSQAQRGYMYTHHPKIAKEFEEKTSSGKLPEHKDSKSMRKHMSERVDGPESFHKAVEKKLSEISNISNKEDEPKWNSGKNPDQTMCKP
jgi:hypothetical protein